MPELHSREIAPTCSNVPSGWPRPYYRTDDGRLCFATWSSANADGQIMNCPGGKTFVAAEHHLCSSCGAQMARGLVFDREKLVAMHDPGTVLELTGVCDEEFAPGIAIAELDETDTHYGSPLCFRCAVFARQHCPYLGALHSHVGDSFPWRITTSGHDYREFDWTTGIELLDGESLSTITTGEVTAEVRAGRTYLTGRSADDVRPWIRPTVPMPAPNDTVEIDVAWDPTSPGNTRAEF
jgi:hypothetical protein